MPTHSMNQSISEYLFAWDNSVKRYYETKCCLPTCFIMCKYCNVFNVPDALKDISVCGWGGGWNDRCLCKHPARKYSGLDNFLHTCMSNYGQVLTCIKPDSKRLLLKLNPPPTHPQTHTPGTLNHSGTSWLHLYLGSRLTWVVEVLLHTGPH